MRAGATRPSLQGPDTSEGRNSHGAALPGDALVWALSALTQAFRIPFDGKLVTGQMPPPYRVNSIALAADLLGLRAAWTKRPASALRKLAPPFWSWFILLYASRTTVSSPAVRVLPPLTPR